jgi:hypothetical protein
MRRLLTFAALVVSGILSAGPGAMAYSITVNNPSFEILPPGGLPFGNCGAGCNYSFDVIPGWTVTGATGQFHPGVVDGNTAFFYSVPDGITVAFSNGGSISQTVGPTSVAGQTYTLEVYLGFRRDLPDPGSSYLVIGGIPTLALGTPLQGSGDWSLYTASYTAPASGLPIEVLLQTPGGQGDWDKVSLSATPLPPALLLFGTALAGLGLLGRRRRRISAPPIK